MLINLVLVNWATRAGVVSGVPPKTLNVYSVLFIVDCLYMSSMCMLVAEDVSCICAPPQDPNPSKKMSTKKGKKVSTVGSADFLVKLSWGKQTKIFKDPSICSHFSTENSYLQKEIIYLRSANIGDSSDIHLIVKIIIIKKWNIFIALYFLSISVLSKSKISKIMRSYISIERNTICWGQIITGGVRVDRKSTANYLWTV